MVETAQQWYVFYTKSRHEKKVKELLTKRGYEVFLPMQKVMRQWSDRKKKIEMPLFNSYIFVKSAEYDIVNILQIPGVSWTIRHNGKPAVLQPGEYDKIQRFLASGLFLETTGVDPDLHEGDRAQVMDGPLAGITGTLSGTGNQRKLNVLLEGINQVIRIEIRGELLKKI